MLANFYKLFAREMGQGQTEENDFRVPFDAQDSLASPTRLGFLSNGQIEFSWENQGNWACRCNAAEFNPEVFSNCAELYGDGEGFQSVSGSLFEFLVTITLQELVMSAPVCVSIDAADNTEIFPFALEPVWLNGTYAYPEKVHNFYYSSEEKVLVMNWGDIWAGCYNSALPSSINSVVDFHVV